MTSAEINQAVALRRAIEQAGGLVAQADLARRWGMGRARANALCAMPDFPEPVATVASKSRIYAAGECDAWLARRRAGRAAA